MHIHPLLACNDACVHTHIHTTEGENINMACPRTCTHTYAYTYTCIQMHAQHINYGLLNHKHSGFSFLKTLGKLIFLLVLLDWFC